mgnify:CR=1 FL=1
MAIKVISGKPGSGKSYYALYKLIVENYDFDKVFYEWKEKQPINIFTNIDGLKLPHESLQHHIEKAGSVYQFFDVDYQRELMKEYPNIRYIIDESQKLFPRKFNETNTLFFFQYHRHLGIDLYLITPDWGALCPQITGLCEYEIRAHSATLTMFKELKYSFYAGFDKVGSTSLPADRKIFALYKSFDLPDQGKKIKPLQKYALQFGGLAMVVVCVLVYFVYGGGFSSGANASATIETERAENKPSSSSISENAVRGRATHSPPPLAQKRSVPKTNLKIVELGGIWVAEKLAYILFNGDFIPVEIFPYTYIEPEKGKRVRCMIPAGELVASTE